jgi:tetratricopeptide (TPR) repeat protein
MLPTVRIQFYKLQLGKNRIEAFSSILKDVPGTDHRKKALEEEKKIYYENWQEFMARINRVLQERPNSEFFLLKAKGLALENKLKFAILTIDEGIKNDPECQFLYSFKAAYQLALKEYPDALTTIQLAITLNPHNDNNFYTLFRIHEEAGELAAAEAALLEAFRLQPYSHLETLQEFYMRTGNEQGVKKFKAISVDLGI